MRILTIITACLAAVALTAGMANAAGKSGFFKTQNNCAKQGVDYVGNRIAMNATGKAKVQACAGDAGPFADPSKTKVLKPGKTWRGGGMSCTATTSTVRCTNKSK